MTDEYREGVEAGVEFAENNDRATVLAMTNTARDIDKDSWFVLGFRSSALNHILYNQNS